MKIKILEHTVIAGEDVAPGDKFEVDQHTGDVLLSLGRAEIYVPDETPTEKPKKTK